MDWTLWSKVTPINVGYRAETLMWMPVENYPTKEAAEAAMQEYHALCGPQIRRDVWTSFEVWPRGVSPQRP